VKWFGCRSYFADDAGKIDQYVVEDDPRKHHILLIS